MNPSLMALANELEKIDFDKLFRIAYPDKFKGDKMTYENFKPGRPKKLKFLRKCRRCLQF